MPKILVLFSSRTGSTAALADAIAEGARAVRFAEVDVRRIADLAPASPVAANDGARALAARYQPMGPVEELAQYDALILGTPARHGAMAAELAHLLDQAGPLVNRVGAAFTTAAAGQGGQETALWSVITAMASLGMLLVPPGSGASGSGAPGEPDLAAARALGKRVAEVTGWVTHAKSHHHH